MRRPSARIDLRLHGDPLRFEGVRQPQRQREPALRQFGLALYPREGDAGEDMAVIEGDLRLLHSFFRFGKALKDSFLERGEQRER